MLGEQADRTGGALGRAIAVTADQGREESVLAPQFHSLVAVLCSR